MQQGRWDSWAINGYQSVTFDWHGYTRMTIPTRWNYTTSYVETDSFTKLPVDDNATDEAYLSVLKDGYLIQFWSERGKLVLDHRYCWVHDGWLFLAKNEWRGNSVNTRWSCVLLRDAGVRILSNFCEHTHKNSSVQKTLRTSTIVLLYGMRVRRLRCTELYVFGTTFYLASSLQYWSTKVFLLHTRATYIPGVSRVLNYIESILIKLSSSYARRLPVVWLNWKRTSRSVTQRPSGTLPGTLVGVNNKHVTCTMDAYHWIQRGMHKWCTAHSKRSLA